MNEDLLKRFVELAPEEWGAEFEDGTVWTGESDVTICLTQHEGSEWSLDFRNSEASIFLWDYIGEELGTIGISNNWPLDLGGPFNVGWDWDEMGCNQCKSGKTRIEALVRACVAYWESTGNQEGE